MLTTTTKTAKTVIRLTTPMREFLQILQFPEIPEEAEALVFWEDGEAQFFETFPFGAEGGYAVPSTTLLMINMYEDIPVQIQE